MHGSALRRARGVVDTDSAWCLIVKSPRNWGCASDSFPRVTGVSGRVVGCRWLGEFGSGLLFELAGFGGGESGEFLLDAGDFAGTEVPHWKASAWGRLVPHGL